MSDIHGFKLDYAEISERMQWLLGVNSRLVLVENSPEALEGGIYKWDEATTAGSLAKNALIEDYMILVTRMRMDLEEQNNLCQMNSFDQSCKTVLHYQKQDTYAGRIL